jgi:hypothetical protein
MFFICWLVLGRVDVMLGLMWGHLAYAYVVCKRRKNTRFKTMKRMFNGYPWMGCAGLAVFRANSAHLNTFTTGVFLASVCFNAGA